MQINLLVLNHFPEPLDDQRKSLWDKAVIPSSTICRPCCSGCPAAGVANEDRTGELTALIRVHDLGRAVPQDGLLQRTDTGIECQAIG